MSNVLICDYCHLPIRWDVPYAGIMRLRVEEATGAAIVNWDLHLTCWTHAVKQAIEAIPRLEPS